MHENHRIAVSWSTQFVVHRSAGQIDERLIKLCACYGIQVYVFFIEIKPGYGERQGSKQQQRPEYSHQYFFHPGMLGQ